MASSRRGMHGACAAREVACGKAALGPYEHLGTSVDVLKKATYGPSGGVGFNSRRLGQGRCTFSYQNPSGSSCLSPPFVTPCGGQLAPAEWPRLGVGGEGSSWLVPGRSFAQVVEESNMADWGNRDIPVKKRNVGSGSTSKEVDTFVSANSGEGMGKNVNTSNQGLSDEEFAEKMQMEELSCVLPELVGDVLPEQLSDVCTQAEDKDGITGKNSTEDVGDGLGNISDEYGGKIQITDSDELVDSQESVDFAARVGIMLLEKDKEHEDEDRRRCDRLKMKDDKSVLELATSLKEAKNAFVDKEVGGKGKKSGAGVLV
ncbi:hypothetical protein GUJ93_ZPchr0008g13517 [Zizania palustris]|uniref:Uncharacterized protein n=1 Tax=Zizania palustris TaxID=103762 RepID=A0A8J5R457_ZIZPA|nr:hypothetical protein GUJ93_ZPchr0008g13517 [Zizania palustris]